MPHVIGRTPPERVTRRTPRPPARLGYVKPLDGKAALVDVLLVTEVWQGGVHVFDVQGHPKATRADAWESPIGGTRRRRFYAVLHTASIRSPLDAVRAAVTAERRGRQKTAGQEFELVHYRAPARLALVRCVC